MGFFRKSERNNLLKVYEQIYKAIVLHLHFSQSGDEENQLDETKASQEKEDLEMTQ